MDKQDKPITPRAARDLAYAEDIKAAHAASGGLFGAPLVHATLKAQGKDVPARAVRRIMAREKLTGFSGRDRQTVSREYPENLLLSKDEHNVERRDFTATELDRVWGADITQIPTPDGWLYLAVVIDLCSRKVLGWAFSEGSADTRLTLTALEMAVDGRMLSPELIHHSDRGVQYSSAEYQAALKRYGLICSMSRTAKCLDNAVVESFFSTLKRELTRPIGRKPRSEVRNATHYWIACVYNATRLHSALGYVSPLQYERIKRERAKRRKR